VSWLKKYNGKILKQRFDLFAKQNLHDYRHCFHSKQFPKISYRNPKEMLLGKVQNATETHIALIRDIPIDLELYKCNSRESTFVEFYIDGINLNDENNFIDSLPNSWAGFEPRPFFYSRFLNHFQSGINSNFRPRSSN
jgi:hypothetical protein